MKTTPTVCVLIISAALYLPAAHASDFSAINVPAEGLIAQYITDDEDGTRKKDPGKKKTSNGDYQKNESERARPRFIIGVSGGIEAREGYASISVKTPMGMQYERYGLTFHPAYTYMSGKSIKTASSPLDKILRTKMSGQIYEFSLPAMFSYSILDLSSHPYTPYATGGVGYSYRKFSLSGSSLLSRTNRASYLHSMTLNYGFGFLVRTSEDTRFDIGLICQSYFNMRNGPFGYDTTGAAIQFGLMLIVD